MLRGIVASFLVTLALATGCGGDDGTSSPDAGDSAPVVDMIRIEGPTTTPIRDQRVQEMWIPGDLVTHEAAASDSAPDGTRDGSSAN